MSHIIPVYCKNINIFLLHEKAVLINNQIKLLRCLNLPEYVGIPKIGQKNRRVSNVIQAAKNIEYSCFK